MSEDRDKIRDILSAYIDGEVTQEQARSVEQAVAEDPELALELHELTAARRLVMGLPRQRAPRGFVRRVMARAERKHLLGDQQAGGAFGAARWITLAVAAVVLLTAGVGIIAISMLGTGQGPSPMASVDDDGRGPGGPGHMDFNDGSLHGKAGDGRNEKVDKAGGSSATTNGGAVGGRPVIADTAFEYALTNAKNTSIYTHDVSNTLAGVNEACDRNGVPWLELEVPAEDSKPADRTPAKGAEKKPEVSRGELPFRYNKKQDDQQVQIVVLATDTVIEQLKGDIDKLARGEMVSQAPAPDLYKTGSDRGFVARRAGSWGTQKDTDLSNRDGEGMAIARLDGVTDDPTVGKGGWVRAKSKGATETGSDVTVAKGDPAPSAPAAPAPKRAKPVVAPDASGVADSVRPSDIAVAETRGVVTSGVKQPKKTISQTGDSGANNVAPVVVADAGGNKYESVNKPLTPKPSPAKRPIAGPATRPAETVQIAGGLGKDLLESNNSGELEILSAQIAKEQERGETGKKLDVQYGRLNSAFRQQILNDDLRRNVQSQQERGINVQALVININRRSLRQSKAASTQRDLKLHANQALSRPRATTKSSAVSESTTRQAAQPADTSR
ncbi:MAG: hypothetical protein ISS69_18265 [Phycisphaerae bacterium]|nr:hypothetical protein [Phycisphaerae bacterium]